MSKPRIDRPPVASFNGRTYLVDTPEKEAAVTTFRALRDRMDVMREHYQSLAIARAEASGFTAHSHGTLQVQILVPAGHILVSFADRTDVELTVRCRPYEGFDADLADFAAQVPRVAAVMNLLSVLCTECKSQVAALAAEQAICLEQIATPKVS